MNLSKYLALFILIIVFVFDLSFAEDKQYGFQDIPFGTSYDEVKKKLEETYKKMHHTYLLRENFISFNHFDLGNNEIEIQATFDFDHNKRFYGFHFTTKERTADRFSSEVYKEGEYLTDVFKNKYGEPSKCYKPNILTVQREIIPYLCEWNHKDLEIFTGFSFYEARFFAIGYVTLKKLKEEYNSHKKQQENKSAIDGAKKF